MDAVAATLGRDFKTAIDRYARIGDSAPRGDKSAAYVDLGRAHEKSAPDDWAPRRWLASIGDSVMTGATYSAGFPLTLEPLCNGTGRSTTGQSC